MRNDGRRLWIVAASVLAALALGLAGCKSSEEAGKGKEPTGPHAALLKLFPASGDVKPEARPETKASADLRPETKVDLKAALETKAVASEVQKKP